MSRPKFEFTPEQLETIYKMVLIGTPVEDVAYVIGCSRDTIDNNPLSSEQVKKARHESNNLLRQTAYNMATSGENTAMTIFLCKVRLGWKEPREEPTNQTNIQVNTNVTNLDPATVKAIKDWARANAAIQVDGGKAERILLGASEDSES